MPPFYHCLLIDTLSSVSKSMSCSPLSSPVCGTHVSFIAPTSAEADLSLSVCHSKQNLTSLQTGVVLAARLRGFTALSPKPVIVAPDHKTLAILTYDSAILTPHTHSSFKRLFWVFCHSHVPLIQSPSTTIQVWRLGFLFWTLAVLDSYQSRTMCCLLPDSCTSLLF